METKKIKNALISVFYKDGLDDIVKALDKQGVTIYSTGGTYKFIKDLGIDAVTVESLTGYPSILGGRVKTLHPKVFGGILSRRDMFSDGEQLNEYEIPEIDLVIVDLYPFEQTVASGAAEQDIIEKIDIGGISLIRAAAKNYKDVVIVPSVDRYAEFLQIYNEQDGATTLEQRHRFAAYAFGVSSHYDTAIFNHFNKTEQMPVFKCSIDKCSELRYGENPHQKAAFYREIGHFDNTLAACEQLHGKELSYNNINDANGALDVLKEFGDARPCAVAVKHANPCGVGVGDTLLEAYLRAY
ncbi:MAG: bifunctional phosphoribosylaminoimidazolecarboxamide formyltransferase/IMP cyclohydrolase PurH, partial [Bacteroidales bacterium]|nr:bifunctional phosphoribosylaminoimidazolecarboxamide formyltransferase/IMP cyclohydrolase PurH [Bacteroidales bacterium]